MKHYGSIFIGSSPLFLLCHNKLARRGNEHSLLIEASDRLGGAWYYGDLWDAKNIELGCHILKNRPEGYRLMKENGIALKPMDPQPALLITKITGESRLNLLKNSALYLLRRFSRDKSYSKYHIQKLESLVKQRPVARYSYPDRGCFELLQNLQPEPGTFLKGQPVTELRVEQGKATVTLADGTAYSANHIYLSKNYNIARVIVDGAEQTINYTHYISEHYLLKYPKNTVRFAFIECLGDDLVNLVSHVGRYTESNFDIVAVAVKKSTGKPENNLSISAFSGLPSEQEKMETAAQLHRKFIRFGLVPAGTELLDFHYEPYLLHTKDRSYNQELAEKSRHIIIFPDTTDLVESIIKNPILNAD